MPWSERVQQTARAVAHGWKPKGSAKGFTQEFAAQVISESKGKTLKEIMGGKRKKKHDE